MKIIINEKGSENPKTIRVPLGIAANSVTAGLISIKSEELSFSQATKLMKALKGAGKYLDGAPFVEVIDANGDRVTIFL